MLVEHVSFSKSGGAGLVAQNLASNQASLGLRTKLHTFTDSSIRERPLLAPHLTIAAAADKYLVSSRIRDTMFSLYRSQLDLFSLETLEEDSVVHLHWVGGVMSSKNLLRLLRMGRRVVWTLHDMAPFTGGCHHSHGCLGYQANCADCPQANTLFKSTVQALKIEASLPREYAVNLKIVTPTTWMEEQAKKSSRFQNFSISTIPNPVANAFFEEKSRESARKKLGITEECVVFIAISANLSDPAKQINKLVSSFISASKANPTNSLLLLVGAAGERYSNHDAGIRWLGALSSSAVADIACSADWVLSTSVAESAGMTIVECGALRVPAIAIDSGGVRDMISHSITGFINKSQEEFEQCLKRAIDKEVDSARMGQEAQKFSRMRHDPKVAAKSYVELYER